MLAQFADNMVFTPSYAADAWKMVDKIEAQAIANGAPVPEKSARHQFAEESKVEEFVLG